MGLEVLGSEAQTPSLRLRGEGTEHAFSSYSVSTQVDSRRLRLRAEDFQSHGSFENANRHSFLISFVRRTPLPARSFQLRARCARRANISNPHPAEAFCQFYAAGVNHRLEAFFGDAQGHQGVVAGLVQQGQRVRGGGLGRGL